jgi:hypothetical protein
MQFNVSVNQTRGACRVAARWDDSPGDCYRCALRTCGRWICRDALLHRLHLQRAAPLGDEDVTSGPQA